MNQDEIDAIIAGAVEDSRRKSRWHRGSRGGATSTQVVRKWLNTVFMVGFVLTIVIYFAMPESKTLFFSVGFGSIILKVVEIWLRFMF